MRITFLRRVPPGASTSTENPESRAHTHALFADASKIILYYLFDIRTKAKYNIYSYSQFATPQIYIYSNNPKRLYSIFPFLRRGPLRSCGPRARAGACLRLEGDHPISPHPRQKLSNKPGKKGGLGHLW